MKILWKKLRENKIKVLVDSMEDLWYLSNIIQAGDLAHARSMRTVQFGDDRAKEREKKPVNLIVKVEKTDFDRSVNRLRILGVIVAGFPEEYISLGAHHTITIAPGDELVLEKGWKSYEIKMLEAAEKKRPKVILIAIEKGEAVFGFLKEYGLEYSTMRASIPGKDSESREIEDAEIAFFHEIGKTLERYEFERCILCGAGFWKSNLYDFLNEKYKDIAKKCIVENTGSYGENAISELLKRGVVEKLVHESKIAEEVALVNRLLESMGKGNGLCTYGGEETQKAIGYRAIDALMLTDKFLREHRDSVEKMLRDVENGGGRVVIVSGEHEGWKQLDSLGGIAALLRFRIA